jgi:hypothetical protein
MEQTEPRNVLDFPRTESGALYPTHLPDQPDLDLPSDILVVAPRSLVAPRVTFTRRPPEMALTWATPAPQSAPPITNPDIALVSSLPTPELALRFALLAAQIETQVQYGGSAEAIMGLGVLSRQARMYEHLHILQSSTGELE